MKGFLHITTFFFLLNTSLLAQNAGIMSSVTKNNILIGEQFQLNIQATLLKKSNVNISLPDSIPHFFVIDKPKIDTIIDNQSTIIQVQYTLTSFDSGSFYIPSFSIAKGLQTKPIEVNVAFSNFDPQQPYHDIKSIIEIEESETITPWWYYVTGTVILLTLIFLLYKKKKKKPSLSNEMPFQNPYAVALARLKKLQQLDAEDKIYYNTLSDIFREYVFQKKQITSLQNTTGGLLPELKKLSLNETVVAALANALHTCDAVKFAKYKPRNEERNILYNTIVTTIQIIDKH